MARPRNPVKKTYRVSQSTPSSRRSEGGGNYIPPMNKPKPRSRLVDWVEENRAEKRPEAETRELVQAFQNDVCDHPSWRELAKSSTTKISVCTVCGFVKSGKP